MAEDTNTTNMLRSPVLLGMISLLVLLIAGFSVNLYVLSGTGGGSRRHHPKSQASAAQRDLSIY